MTDHISAPLALGATAHFLENKAPEAQQGTGCSTMQSSKIEEIFESNKINHNNNGLSASSLLGNNIKDTLNKLDDEKEKLASSFSKMFNEDIEQSKMSFIKGLIFLMYSGIAGINSESAN